MEIDPTTLIDLLTAIAFLAGISCGAFTGMFLGYMAAQPTLEQRRTLRNALDAYLKEAKLSAHEAEDAKRLRYSPRLKER